MLQSIYSGVSGLQSFQTGIDVLANNISNVNTVGFKGSSTEFANLFELSTAAARTSTSSQVGLGTKVSATALDLNTGSYYQTESTTDLSIVGNDGWFGLSGANGDNYFSRAGNFHFDTYSANGLGEHPFYPYDQSSSTEVRLSNPEGFFVTGTLANNTNNGILAPVVNGLELDLANVDSQVPLVFPSELTYPVQPTTQANFFGNIGVENISQAVSATVISPQSERNNLRLVFNQVVPQTGPGLIWDVTATASTADYNLESGTGTLYDTQNGRVEFDGTGALISSTLGPINNNGASVIANLGTGFSGLASNSGPSVTSSATVDGTLAGDLLDYSINRNGEVISNFTNGRQSVVGKVAIYHFQNDQGLEAISGNLFQASANSGKPIFYEQNNGEILSGTLETSNVTLETALTELIIMQRSYDAVSKTITTGDELLKKALQM